VLYYRRDLLHAYGYTAPPATWDELERMAARIQSGERAKGHNDFWGYIWSGAQTEALVCDALEWQVSEGGGNIINQAGLADLNNPHAIFSWQRATRWVGTISPHSVTEYDEFDGLNAWLAGRAAFMRNWSGVYTHISSSNKAVYDQTGAAIVPAGSAGHASTLGGNAFGVSRYSQHREGAVRLVRFLCRRDVQRRRCLNGSEPPTLPDLYRDPRLRAANPDIEVTYESMQGHLALRPSQQTGPRYPEVAAAYAQAVHSVLTRQKTAAAAARDLQNELNHRRPAH
jgi:trehalose/maltose transport system substrate-binding protein